MRARKLTNSELLDQDVAIIVVTTPVWLTGFLVLIVAGAVADWWRSR